MIVTPPDALDRSVRDDEPQMLADDDAIAQLRPVETSSAADQDEATAFLEGSGLSLSTVVLCLLDQSDDCIKLIGVDGSLQFMNCNGRQVMQIDDFSMVAGKAWNSLWPEESQGLVADAVTEALRGRQVRFEAFCPTAKGAARWWEVTAAPVRSADGTVEAILSTSRDITDRRRREESAATVAVEMRHRLRNAHAVGAALLLASAQSDPEHLEFARTVAERLARLSEIHARLVDVGTGLSLAELCEDIGTLFEQSGGRLHWEGLPDVQLGDERARTISLLLGELTTNSLKHGALGRGGEVRLTGQIEDNVLKIAWDERFASDDENVPSVSSGQGVALMKRMLRLYKGTIDGVRHGEGYSASFSLPLD